MSNKPLSKAALLHKRYMIIEKFPGSPDVGEIIHEANLSTKHPDDHPKLFPIIYRELHWSYNRRPEELPLYVIVNEYVGYDKVGDVLRVQYWEYVFSKENKDRVQWQAKSEGGRTYPAHTVFPATEEDFNQFKK